MGYLAVLLLSALLAGCAVTQAKEAVVSTVVKKVVTRTQTDFGLVSKIAEVANYPEVKLCSDYVIELGNKFKASDELEAKLKDIDTFGYPFASAFKDYVVAKALKENSDVLLQDFEENYPKNCGTIRTQIQMNLLRNALQAVRR